MTAILRQSDSTSAALRKRGCGAYACIIALHEASDGDWDAKGKAGTTSALVRVERSGITDAEFKVRGLTSDEVKASLVAIAATDYRMDVPVKAYHGGKVAAMLDKAEEVGGVLIVAVNYAVVQDAGKGVGSFRGMHWVVAFGRRPGGKATIADPLRRQTVEWDEGLLVRAAERFGDRPGTADDNHWGDGRGEGVVVYPWRTWRQGHALVKDRLEASERALRRTAAQLAACQAGQPTDPDPALAALRSKVKDWAGTLGDMEDQMDAAVAPA